MTKVAIQVHISIKLKFQVVQNLSVTKVAIQVLHVKSDEKPKNSATEVNICFVFKPNLNSIQGAELTCFDEFGPH